MAHPTQCVVITGASAGLGIGFAHRFAARGADVVLVARRKDRLEALAAELTAAHGITATVLTMDLIEPGAGARLAAALDERGLAVDALVNNAGFGTAGPFVDADAAKVRDEITVNVLALTDLSLALLPRLIASGHGLLVNVASNAAYQPLPTLAVYAATKAYVKSLTEAIWKETQGTGMRVLALAPGPTETEFFEVAGSTQFVVGSLDTVNQVMDVAFKAIDRRKGGPTVIVGLQRAISAHANRLVPTRFSLWTTARLLSGGKK